tara:strand:+ start:432 stop:779 length:348 start_codon:yes stop_codon:yes gene_type:complete
MSNSKFKNVYTMIGPDAKIHGPINLDQGIIIYGKVIGDIITHSSVRIAKDGIVEGNVKCSDIVLGGTVIGHIESEGSVTLKSSSKLKGDIKYRKLHIEDGSQFEGQCDMLIESVK